MATFSEVQKALVVLNNKLLEQGVSAKYLYLSMEISHITFAAFQQEKKVSYETVCTVAAYHGRDIELELSKVLIEGKK